MLLPSCTHRVSPVFFFLSKTAVRCHRAFTLCVGLARIVFHVRKLMPLPLPEQGFLFFSVGRTAKKVPGLLAERGGGW